MPAPIEIVKGDTAVLLFDIEQSDADALDLTDYAVDFLILRSTQDNDAAAEYFGDQSNSVAITHELVDGEVTVTIPSDATNRLRVGRLYFFKLRLTYIPTGEIFSPVDGNLRVNLPS